MNEIGTREHVEEQLERANRSLAVSNYEAMAYHLGVAVVSALLAIGDDLEGLWKGER